VPAAVAGLACWLYILIAEGPILALQTSFLLIIGVLSGSWTLLMRLRFTSSRMGLTIGPWRRHVNLDLLRQCPNIEPGDGAHVERFSCWTLLAIGSPSTLVASIVVMNGTVDTRCG
jgi:hypothetical protein